MGTDWKKEPKRIDVEWNDGFFHIHEYENTGHENATV